MWKPRSSWSSSLVLSPAQVSMLAHLVPDSCCKDKSYLNTKKTPWSFKTTLWGSGWVCRAWASPSLTMLHPVASAAAPIYTVVFQSRIRLGSPSGFLVAALEMGGSQRQPQHMAGRVWPSFNPTKYAKKENERVWGKGGQHKVFFHFLVTSLLLYLQHSYFHSTLKHFHCHFSLWGADRGKPQLLLKGGLLLCICVDKLIWR